MEDIKKIHKNYDAVFKEALMLFKDKALDFLGLDLAPIEEPLNVEVTEIKVAKRFADAGFMLKNKTGLHMEWEAEISLKDMIRFCNYNLDYMRTYQTNFVTVIFTNKKPTFPQIDNETIRFTPIIINLGERDGDALLQNIKSQIENNQPVNELCLIYLPLYHSEHRNVAELLMQVVELAPLIAKSKEESEKIMVMSAILVNKFVDRDDFKKIWEAIKMDFDDLWFIEFAKRDALAEGIAEGKAVGIAEGKTVGLAEGKAAGLAEGKAVGLAEGRVGEKTEMIVRMLKKGVDAETVAEYADIPANKVYKIRESLVNNL